MRFIKRVVVWFLQALLILAFIYVTMQSWDGSVAFNDERVANHKANYERIQVEMRR